MHEDMGTSLGNLTAGNHRFGDSIKKAGRLEGNVPKFLLCPENLGTLSENLIPSPPLWKCPGRFLGIMGQGPRVSKSIWLYIVIFWFFFINLRYILYIRLKQLVH